MSVSMRLYDLVSRILALGLSVAFLSDRTKHWLVGKIETWTKSNGWWNNTAWHLQKPYAKSMGGEICEYCNWAILPGNPHIPCEFYDKARSMTDDELQKAWEGFTADTSSAINPGYAEDQQLWYEIVRDEMMSRDLL